MRRPCSSHVYQVTDTPASRRHLLTLAERTPTDSAEVPDAAPDALVRLIDSMEPAPAYVLGPCWEFLAWNTAQARLYPAIATLPGEHRNLLWVVFADPDTRTLIDDWEGQSARILAEFRAGTAALRGTPPWQTLVDDLTARSPEFAERWAHVDVAGFQTRLRRYHHPRAGELVFEYQQLTPSEWPGLRVVCQLPVPGDDSAARLAAWREIA
jgi:MmyB-like transcription regulator ligand binding domain